MIFTRLRNGIFLIALEIHVSPPWISNYVTNSEIMSHGLSVEAARDQFFILEHYARMHLGSLRLPYGISSMLRHSGILYKRDEEACMFQKLDLILITLKMASSPSSGGRNRVFLQSYILSCFIDSYL